jgi:hypothetical protein
VVPDCLTYAVSRMKDLLLTLLHLARHDREAVWPGGVRAVIAENLLLKQQLIVLRRARQRAPNLTLSDRLLCWIRDRSSSVQDASESRHSAYAPRRSWRFIRRWCVASTADCSRRARAPKKPGPKGPSEALIQAILELKSRNPRFGCPRIARIISHTFGVDIDKNVVYRVLSKHYRPASGRSRALVVVVHRTHDETACGAWTSFDASPSCSGATGCSWSWTSSRVASSESACTCVRSMAPTSAACSTPPFMVGHTATSQYRS